MMRMMNMKTWMAAAAAMIGAAGPAHADTVQPSQRALSRAVQQFLTDHGDLCMAKYVWPRDVTSADRQANSNDAVQLPVLERLGLVESTVIPPPDAAAVAVEPARRYSLTAKGRQYYLRKKHTTLNVHGQPVAHDADFCVAQLTLDKVVKWTPPEPAHGQSQTLVHYTYHIKAADWMADPDARKVFPVVDRIIHGQGTLLMTATVQLRDGKWVPVLPGQ